MDDTTRIRCPSCARTLGARVNKGKVEVRMKRSKRATFAVEVVVGAVICPRCGYRLNVPVSALEAPVAKPSTQQEKHPLKEASNA